MNAPSLRGLAAYLGVVQFLLLAGWTVYAIFLPGLLAAVGIGRQWAPWVLLADQVLFACFDIAAGFAADRAFRLYARIGYWVAAGTALSCIAFLALPWLPGMGSGGAPLFLALTAIWVVSSSALRSPLFGLLARHAATPETPGLAGIALLGMGLAAALSPYLGTVMTGLDPRLPFAVSSFTLLLAALGLVAAERRFVPPAPSPVQEATRPAIPAWGFLAALLIAALAFQIGVFLHAGPRYLREVAPDQLPWVLPVFWIGFNLTVFTAGTLARHWGSLRTFIGGCLVAGLGLWLTGEPGLGAALTGYSLAGLGWGAALAMAFGLAAECGGPGRAATFTGMLFAVLAMASFTRIGLNLTGWPATAGALLYLLPAVGWAAGGLLLLAVARRYGAGRPGLRG